MTDNGGRLAEAAAVAALGGALAAGVGAPFGVALPAAAVAGANGAVSGWRRIYDWSCSKGFVAFALDSTWALPMTAAGLVANSVGIASRRSGYVAQLSERRNRHVYRRGFTPRKGYAITLGNVIGGAGDVDKARRRRLVSDHEDVHVWQARWFGPLFPVLYGGWMVGGALASPFIWLARGRRDPFPKLVESTAYYLNPFEWWAYSRDDHWPPGGLIAGYGWRHPWVRPLSKVRGTADAGTREPAAG